MQRVRLPLTDMRVDGERLFHLRTSAGITQAAVAERAMISEQWYRRIERHGQQPSLPVARDIADALGCDLTDFCTPVVESAA